MVADTGTLPDPLAAFVRAHREEIVRRWEMRVQALPSARALPAPVLREQVIMILEQVEALLARVAAKEDVAEPAERHGVERVSQGYPLEEVLLEMAALRDMTLEVRSAAGALVGDEAVRIVRAFDPVVSAVVHQYALPR
jgi:hypothetical protein